MNYMWSHGIVDASNCSGESVAIQNMSCRACDRSNSSVDVRHNVTYNFIYDLPFGPGKAFLNSGPTSKLFGGWSLCGMVTARTGLPVNITMSGSAGDLRGGDSSNQWRNRIPGPASCAANELLCSGRTRG